ncbi:hypothetical protein P7C73_g3426, partial [Tremellales sp. Uapishka_1]
MAATNPQTTAGGEEVQPSSISAVNPQAGHAVLPAEHQQAATAPGAGEVVGDAPKVPFKEQVNGYAKIMAGKVFQNKNEVKLGEEKLDGEA